MDRSMLDELKDEIIEAIERKGMEIEPNSSIHKSGTEAVYTDGVICGLCKATEIVDLTIYKYKHDIH